MGNTSSKVKNRYAAKAYDQVRLLVPKGCKQLIDARAADNGESTNAYLNRLIRFDLSVSESEWKRRED